MCSIQGLSVASIVKTILEGRQHENGCMEEEPCQNNCTTNMSEKEIDTENALAKLAAISPKLKVQKPFFTTCSRFPTKLHHAACDERVEFIIWSPSGNSVYIHRTLFESNVLQFCPGLVQVNDFKNLRRQLLVYGFDIQMCRQMLFSGPDAEFVKNFLGKFKIDYMYNAQHPYFKRDEPEKSALMQTKKPTKEKNTRGCNSSLHVKGESNGLNEKKKTRKRQTYVGKNNVSATLAKYKIYEDSATDNINNVQQIGIPQPSVQVESCIFNSTDEEASCLVLKTLPVSNTNTFPKITSTVAQSIQPSIPSIWQQQQPPSYAYPYPGGMFSSSMFYNPSFNCQAPISYPPVNPYNHMNISAAPPQFAVPNSMALPDVPVYYGLKPQQENMMHLPTSAVPYKNFGPYNYGYDLSHFTPLSCSTPVKSTETTNVAEPE